MDPRLITEGHCEYQEVFELALERHKRIVNPLTATLYKVAEHQNVLQLGLYTAFLYKPTVLRSDLIQWKDSLNAWTLDTMQNQDKSDEGCIWITFSPIEANEIPVYTMHTYQQTTGVYLVAVLNPLYCNEGEARSKSTGVYFLTNELDL